MLTQPDRPAGRGLRPAASPVKRSPPRADSLAVKPASLKNRPGVERIRAARPDALVVAAYGLLLPQACSTRAATAR